MDHVPKSGASTSRGVKELESDLPREVVLSRTKGRATPNTGAADRPEVLRGRRLLLESAGAALLVSIGLLLFGTSDLLLVGSFNDDGVYVALGKAIAEGEGYRSIHLPGSPVHTKYPPGLPGLLALLWSIGGTLPVVVVLAQAANLLAVAGAAALSWWYGRAVLNVAALPLAVLGLGPFFLETALHYNSLILSEPYVLLGWFGVLAAYSWFARQETAPDRWRAALVLGLLLAATSLFRVQGVVLIAAVLALLAIERRGVRAWLICAAAGVVPLIAWGAIHRTLRARGPVSSHPDELSYLDWVRSQDDSLSVLGAIERVGGNIVDYAGAFARYASGSEAFGTILVLAFVAATAAGVWTTRRRAPTLAATILPMAAVVACWPFTQDRLALGVLPVLGLAAAAGVDAGARRLPRRTRTLAGFALATLAGVLALRQVEVRREALHGAETGAPPAGFSATFAGVTNSRYIESVSRWLVANARPTDRVLTEFPAGIYLHTGLRAVGSMVGGNDIAQYTFRTPGEFLARRILEDGVSIVTLGNLSQPIARDIATVMERCPGVLTYAGGIGDRPIPAFYRVVPDERCLRERVLMP